MRDKKERKNERKKEEERSPLALCNPTCPGWYKDTVLSWSTWSDKLLMFLLSDNVLFAVSVNVVKRIEEVDYHLELGLNHHVCLKPQSPN